MNRRTMLRTAASAAGLVPFGASGILRNCFGSLQDDALLAAARERIERIRKTDGVIVVRNASGHAVPNAQVTLEQTNHAFRFGANLYRFELGRDDRAEAAYREQFAAVFNYATLRFYWARYEAERGRPRHAFTERITSWARTNNIACKGHPLAWDYIGSAPEWLPRNLEEVERLSRARVTECVKRFRGQIDIWDVVNEPMTLGRYYQNPMSDLAKHIGTVEFIRRHLEVARAANPTATLIVNERAPEVGLVELAKPLLVANPKLFDAVGVQTHMFEGTWPLRQVLATCDTFAALGVPVHFTETTVVSGTMLRADGTKWNPTNAKDEERQADYVARLYTVLFSHPAVAAVTWWDFTDDGAWREAPSGWLRSDMSPKPVYDRMRDLIKRDWWTRASGRTDAKGEFPARAFMGTHRVTVETPSGLAKVVDVAWTERLGNRVTITIN